MGVASATLKGAAAARGPCAPPLPGTGALPVPPGLARPGLCPPGTGGWS